jgi:hypothetical protein
MSDTRPPVPKFEPISEEQLERISGGSCTPEEWIKVFGELKGAYEELIDFTSYVIERVATSTTS